MSRSSDTSTHSANPTHLPYRNKRFNSGKLQPVLRLAPPVLPTSYGTHDRSLGLVPEEQLRTARAVPWYFISPLTLGGEGHYPRGVRSVLSPPSGLQRFQPNRSSDVTVLPAPRSRKEHPRPPSSCSAAARPRLPTCSPTRAPVRVRPTHDRYR